MTLRNTMVQLVDYRNLEGIIDTNKSFACSDLDMIYERNGKFLVAEWKKDGESISFGQERLLKALAQTPNFIVLVIRGYSENTKLIVKKIHLMKKDGTLQMKYEYEDLDGGNLEDGLIKLTEIIQSWYKWADNVQK